ncbi:hypothetical protein KFE25_005443 [Diacronema lutheri]|uniref:Uncharacterized protein n=1 Tax=Diacronema lutheri TaxID=2081491 RepID=A0A8J5XF36_DIALT|nr:hypothetical protein KFE25_005443 [Diacronema lutheri]
MASPGPRRSPRHLESVESPSEAYLEDALVGQMLPRPPGGECPLVDDFLSMTYAPRDLVEAVVKLGGRVQRVMLRDLGKDALQTLVGSCVNALVQSNKAHKHLAVVKSIVTVSSLGHCGRPHVRQDIPILAKYAQRYTRLKCKWGLSRPPVALLPLNQAGAAPSGGERAAPAPGAAPPLAAGRRMSFGSFGFVDEGADEGASSLFGRPSGGASSVGGGAFLDDGQGDDEEPQEPANVDPHAKKKINWSTPMHIRLLHVARSPDVVNQSLLGQFELGGAQPVDLLRHPGGHRPERG